MRRVIFFGGLLFSMATNAEVYKCIEKSGKTLYQSSPCKATSKEQQLKIQSDPVKEAEAKARLEEVQSEYDTRKTAQQQADKQLTAERYEAAKLEIANRKAIALQEQADAQKRQAEALENQNQNANTPVYILPPPLVRDSIHNPIALPKPRKPQRTDDD